MGSNEEKIEHKRQQLVILYWEIIAEISCEDTTDEHAFWLGQELIGIGMEMEELDSLE